MCGCAGVCLCLFYTFLCLVPLFEELFANVSDVVLNTIYCNVLNVLCVRMSYNIIQKVI